MSELESLLAKVDRTIAPGDRMMTHGEEHYLYVGWSAIEAIRLGLAAAGKREVRNILDMPCGHGRVMRWLKGTFPEAHLTGCDLLREGVDFCAKQFEAMGIYSKARPAEGMFAEAGKFDLIFVGSLFSHLEAERWGEFLRLFAGLLEEGGVLVFSTDGPFVAYRMACGESYGYLQQANPLVRAASKLLRPLKGKAEEPVPRVPLNPEKWELPKGSPIWKLLAAYEETGFGFLSDGAGSGISVATPAWVMGCIAEIEELRVVMYQERGWGEHQDVVAVVKRGFDSPELAVGEDFMRGLRGR